MSDSDLKAELARYGDPGAFFVFQDSICALDANDDCTAFQLWSPELASAIKVFLRSNGQIRDTIPKIFMRIRVE